MLLSKVSMADSHDKEQNIIDKAKEINKKIKEKQANSQSNISSEINDEEPLPLNDPFAGDSSLTGGNTIVSSNPEEAQNEMSLYKFKLVGIMTSSHPQMSASHLLGLQVRANGPSSAIMVSARKN